MTTAKLQSTECTLREQPERTITASGRIGLAIPHCADEVRLTGTPREHNRDPRIHRLWRLRL